MTEIERVPTPDPEGPTSIELEEVDGATDVTEPRAGLTSLMELSGKERGVAGVFGLVFLGQLGWTLRMLIYPPSASVLVVSVGIALLGLGLLAGAAFGRIPVWFRLMIGV